MMVERNWLRVEVPWSVRDIPAYSGISALISGIGLKPLGKDGY
jgi:hypothetical protein